LLDSCDGLTHIIVNRVAQQFDEPGQRDRAAATGICMVASLAGAAIVSLVERKRRRAQDFVGAIVGRSHRYLG